MAVRRWFAAEGAAGDDFGEWLPKHLQGVRTSENRLPRFPWQSLFRTPAQGCRGWSRMARRRCFFNSRPHMGGGAEGRSRHSLRRYFDPRTVWGMGPAA